jgi:hypothetical protein
LNLKLSLKTLAGNSMMSEQLQIAIVGGGIGAVESEHGADDGETDGCEFCDEIEHLRFPSLTCSCGLRRRS